MHVLYCKQISQVSVFRYLYMKFRCIYSRYWWIYDIFVKPVISMSDPGYVTANVDAYSFEHRKTEWCAIIIHAVR